MAGGNRNVADHDASRSLLLAVARLGDNGSAVEDALCQRPDWTVVAELALYHRLVPSLAAAIADATEAVPDDLQHALRAYCTRQREQSAELLGELFALLDTLRDVGIHAVPFKGPVLAATLRPIIGQRSPGDLDLLIRPQDVRTVREVLESRGYHDAGRGVNAPPLGDAQRRLYERYQCEYQYARESDGMVVEPHWELCQRPLALDVDYTGMLDRARHISIEGRSVLSLTAEDLLVALAVHGAKHQWQRLAWIRDVAGLLAVYPSIDLGRVLDTAGRKGYIRLLLLSLAVAREYCGAILPPDVARLVEADSNLVSLLGDIRSRLFDPETPEPRNDRVEPFRLKLRERRLDRLKYVVRTVFSPRRLHLESAPLPSRANWAYYPLKIGIDYAAAPVWRAIGRLRR